MKMKNLMLSAVVVVAGPAFAQHNVTLYGNLDTGVLTITNASGGIGYLPSTINNGRQTILKDGGLASSNWGIKGTESLGGSFKALFQLQGNINTATGVAGGPNSSGSTSFFNQMAVVGLSGDLGTIKLGRQASPMYFAFASTDARGGRYFGSALTALVGMNSASKVFIGNNSNVAFGAIYNDNSLVYTSPAWNNLTLNVEYALGEGAGGGRANVQEALTLMYQAGGLKLSALYYNGYGNNLPTATTLYTAALNGNVAAARAAVAAAGFSPSANTNRLASVGALYTWGAYTVSSAFYDARNPANAVVPGGSGRLNMWTIGGAWKAAPNMNLTAGYYKIKDKTNAGNTASQFAVGFDYYVSKRTILYAEGASVTNNGANMNLSPVFGTAVAADSDAHAFMVGVRHSF